MWFLKIDVLIIMTCACFLTGILFKYKSTKLIMSLMPLISLGILIYVSEKLAVFYLLYTGVTFLYLLLLRKAKYFRKQLFFLFCIGCMVPLIYFRFEPILNLTSLGVMLIGLAYNMLKAIDALYYEYFTGERIKFSVYLNYILFFPVITAGPVFRFRDFKKTWQNPKPMNVNDISKGIKRMIAGLFKKVVLSMLASVLLGALVALELKWYIALFIPMISWCILYLDMSGYADIAIGMGNIIGITVPENFKKPLQAPSFTQFWRNWHVTVSDWIREHVLILFSGKKLNKYHGAVIGFCVMFIMSLWHGFSMLFVLDGILLGVIIALESLLGITTLNKRKTPKWHYRMRSFTTNYIFALNSLIFTLTVPEIKQVIAGFLTL